ncbi:MAG: PorT family protein [Flavobacteriales bacterium]|nr:PorT family protein [Flavobacteriales bacterium]
MKKLLILVAFLSCLPAIGQINPCKDGLYKANKLYESGKFQEAIDLLLPCVSGRKFQRNENFDANRLLALCYTYLNNVANAELHIHKMLELRPGYQQYPYVDPGEFRSLLNQFTVNNRLDIGIEIGFGNNWVRSIKNFATAQTGSTYRSGAGFQAGFILEYLLNDKWSIVGQPQYSYLTYGRTLEDIAGSKKEYSELLLGYKVPLGIRYYFNFNAFKIYLQTGVHYSRISKSFADVQSTNLNDGTVFQSSTETSEYRNRNLFGYHASIGGSKKIGEGLLSLGVEYNYGFNNLTNEDKRYDNVDFILSSQYIDSDFSLNALNLKLGYQWHFLHSILKRK